MTRPIRDNFDILIFSCVGREHLLARTMSAIRALNSTVGARTILALDGPVNLHDIDLSTVDVILQRPKRSGYVSSIISALPHVMSPYILWVEDDWDIDSISLDQLRLANDILCSDSTILQVRWPKDYEGASGPLVAKGIRRSPFAFSANPHLSGTAKIRAAFDDLSSTLSNGGLSETRLGFETYIERFADTHGWGSLVFDPDWTGLIAHLGDLESTDRIWHFVGADSAVVAGSLAKSDYRRGYNLLSLIPRFMASALVTLICALFREQDRELAFRFIQARRLR